ncbi:MAG TPA: phospholipase D-like domain-containing protein [Actinomycetota bacterium]
MRRTEAGNGLTLTVYAGTTGTHLAWDLDESLRDDLLGFAVKRFGGTYPHGVFLKGGITFPGQDHPPGFFLDTDVAPIQAFRWGDYAVYPGTRYRYEVIPMGGAPGALVAKPSVTVEVTTEWTYDFGSKHRIAFNRAVAASQAFGRRFGDADPTDNSLARQWLGHGLDEFIGDFFERAAGEGWALDVSVYEYEQPEVRDVLQAAHERGVHVRVLYHAQPGDAQTTTNETNLKADGFARYMHARVTTKICHDKTAVLSQLDGDHRTPIAVLTGSTNWTLNGLYYQANVSHVIDDPALAARYLALFEQLWDGLDPEDTRTWIDAQDPIAENDPIELLFSPRSGQNDLARYVSLIDGAERTVLFMTAFDLYDDVLSALAGETGNQGVLRWGLQNSASRVTGYDRTHDRNFTARGSLRTAPKGFIPESSHGQDGSILIHGKIILLDFDTANPTVITGSANYSYSSSYSNDENALVIHGDARVADVYLCELFRWYDHYRFRYNVSQASKKPEELDTSSTEGTIEPRLELDTTPAWADSYYEDGDPHFLERTRLAHPLT